MGYANGLTVIADEETGTLWDHITGEAFEGPLKGEILEAWPTFITTVEVESASHPQTQLYSSSYRSPGMWVMQRLARLTRIGGKGWIPPSFYRSMATPIDSRLPKLTQGLGVLAEGKARYYPLDRLPRDSPTEDSWNGRTLRLEWQEGGTPLATWRDGGELPMQFLSRWYGFSFSYPECTIYRDRSREPVAADDGGASVPEP